MPKQIIYLRALNRNIENYANHDDDDASFCEKIFAPKYFFGPLNN